MEGPMPTHYYHEGRELDPFYTGPMREGRESKATQQLTTTKQLLTHEQCRLLLYYYDYNLEHKSINLLILYLTELLVSSVQETDTSSTIISALVVVTVCVGFEGV